MSKLISQRQAFTEEKSIKLQQLLSSYSNYDLDITNNIDDIDKELIVLDISIKSSVELAKSIIDPIKEKQTAIKNIGTTLDILNVEREIKQKLIKLTKTVKIEDKINIILEANKLINSNHYLFDNYKISFIKEGNDVFVSLEDQFNKNKDRLLTLFNNTTIPKEREKDEIPLTEFLQIMEKTGILIYKLTSNCEFINLFYDILAKSFYYPSLNSLLNKKQNKLIFNESTTFDSIQTSLDENFNTLVTIIRNFIINTNKRVSMYKADFEEKEYFSILINMLHKLIENMLILVQVQVKQVNQLIEYYEGNLSKQNSSHQKSSHEYDSISQSLVQFISKLVSFKFFCLCADSKIRHYSNSTVKIDTSKIFTLLKPYDHLAYDLGGIYLKYELEFIKYNLKQIFKADCKVIQLDKIVNQELFELVGTTLSPIEDFFYILKVASARAIETLDLQLCLPVFNHIKDILLEDLLQIIDLKLSPIINTEYKNNNYSELLHYSSNYSDPQMSNKNLPSNLYVIICLNMISQCLDNSNLLLEEAKEQINKSYFDKLNINKAFDSSKVCSDISNDDSFEFSLFKSTDSERVGFTFQETDSLTKTYDLFINKKINMLIDIYLKHYIKSSVDIMNSANYNIDMKNALVAEMAESFSNKFIEETEKILMQWQKQLTEGALNRFISIYVSYIVLYMENKLLNKKYTIYGLIILDKDINKLVNYFNSLVNISLRNRFNRLLSFVKVLCFESNQEIEDYMMQDNDIGLNMNEIENIRKLKI